MSDPLPKNVTMPRGQMIPLEYLVARGAGAMMSLMQSQDEKYKMCEEFGKSRGIVTNTSVIYSCVNAYNDFLKHIIKKSGYMPPHHLDT